jgi:glycerol-3-phosphate O-acyltransferase/dihydroxyacetone phosphate acyltransferase
MHAFSYLGQVVEAMCKLYYPLGKPKDTFAEAYLLRRRMLESYLEQKDRNETIDLASDVIEYQRQLRGLGILDDHVALPNLSFGPNCWMLVRQSLLLVIALTLVLPGLLLFGPLSLVAEHYAWKRARFLTSVSPWRKTGLDTVSTGRVLNILKTMPILFTLYAIVVSFYMGSSQHQALSLVVSLIFVVVISSFITAVTVFATDLASDILQSRGPPIFSSSPPNKTVLANLRSCREELSYKVHKFFTISESQPGNASRDTARYHKAER